MNHEELMAVNGRPLCLGQGLSPWTLVTIVLDGDDGCQSVSWVNISGLPMSPA